MKILRVLLCFFALAWVSSEAGVIEVTPVDAYMNAYMAGGDAPAAGGGDSNAMGHYDFEDDWPTNGSLYDTATGSASANDLDTNGVGSPAYPDRSSGDVKEGTYAADMEVNVEESFSLADASLASGFPGKSGGSDTDFSFCAWVKPESLTAMRTLASKYDYGAGERSWLVTIETDGGMGFVLGYNSGGSFTSTVDHEGAIDTGAWHHVCAVYDDDGGADSKGNIQLWVWDDAAADASCSAENNPWDCCTGSGAGTCDESGDKWLMSPAASSNRYHDEDLGQQMSADSGPFGLGCRFNSAAATDEYDGLMDDATVFNDTLTESEIDSIRAGTYTY